MVTHYDMGKDKDGNETITRMKTLPKASGALGAIRDKKELMNEYANRIESGDLTQEEAMKEYKVALKMLQEEGTIFKAKRKNPLADKKKKAKATTKTTKVKSKDLGEVEKSLGDIVKAIQLISRGSKKTANATAEALGFDDAESVVSEFMSSYNDNIGYIEENMGKKGVKTHAKKFTALLKKVKVATNTKAKQNKFGVSEQVGGGLFSTLAGAIPMLINAFKKK
tara:strand:- start:215 stop:886 length:672 start_codon:yes stop_codon:yes gene_type:complete